MLSCLCLDASSSSSEEHDEDDDNGSPEAFSAQPVKDWISLDFGIVRDLAASQVRQQPAAVTTFVCMTDDMQSMHDDAYCTMLHHWTLQLHSFHLMAFSPHGIDKAECVTSVSDLSREVVLAYALQGEQQLGGLLMPLANHRASNGHLFCQEVADVPDKTVLPLKFPVHLGSLSLPVSVRLVTVATVGLLSS